MNLLILPFRSAFIVGKDLSMGKVNLQVVFEFACIGQLAPTIKSQTFFCKAGSGTLFSIPKTDPVTLGVSFVVDDGTESVIKINVLLL